MAIFFKKMRFTATEQDYYNKSAHTHIQPFPPYLLLAGFSNEFNCLRC